MIRVLIVDDSPTLRHLIRVVLESDPALQVGGEAGNGDEAIVLCERLQPDIITMDIHMPKMSGFDAIEHIMANSPRPIVVCTTTISAKELNIAFKAIEAGALAVTWKPGGLPHLDSNADKLIDTVKAMADVKVVRRRPWLLQNSLTPAIQPPIRISEDVSLIAIGASTGGPPAIQMILLGLEQPLPIPIIIVQHITPGFVVGLAHWLDDTTSSTVKLAEHGEVLQPGHVYLAPDEHHLEVALGNQVRLQKSEPVSGHRPSVDAMFKAVAQTLKSRAIGVLLTGMGEDGARGLLSMSEVGAYTISQDEESSVVFGMPKAAIAMGSAQEVLALDAIAPRLASLVKTRKQLR